MKIDLTWVKQNKPLSTVATVLTILVSWSVVEAWLDSKAISEEEFERGQEQQARIDAIQNSRADEFDMAIKKQDLFYGRKDLEYLEDQVSNNPGEEDFERRLAAQRDYLDELKGELCVLRERNGLGKCNSDEGDE